MTTRGKQESQTPWKCGCEEGNAEKNHPALLAGAFQTAHWDLRGPVASLWMKKGPRLKEGVASAVQDGSALCPTAGPCTPDLRTPLRKPVHNSGPR